MRQFPQKKLPVKKKKKKTWRTYLFPDDPAADSSGSLACPAGIRVSFPAPYFYFFPELPMCQSKGWLWKLGGGGLARERT